MANLINTSTTIYSMILFLEKLRSKGSSAIWFFVFIFLMTLITLTVSKTYEIITSKKNKHITLTSEHTTDTSEKSN